MTVAQSRSRRNLLRHELKLLRRATPRYAVEHLQFFPITFAYFVGLSFYLKYHNISPILRNLVSYFLNSQCIVKFLSKLTIILCLQKDIMII